MGGPRRLLLERLGAKWKPDPSKGELHARFIRAAKLPGNAKSAAKLGYELRLPKPSSNDGDSRSLDLKEVLENFRIPSSLVKAEVFDAPPSSSGKENSRGAVVVFRSNPEQFVVDTLNSIRESPSNFWHGSLLLDAKPDKKVVVEFSSPNIAKPFHVGHLRSTLVGNFVANVKRAMGESVVTLNFLGDWGTQFGVLRRGLDASCDSAGDGKDWKARMASMSDPLSFFHQVYVEANASAEKNPEFMKEALAKFSELELADKQAVEDWTVIREASLKELKKTYNRLGISFDSYEGESQYPNQSVMEVVRNLRSHDDRITEDDVGRTIAALGNGRTVTLVKSDGTSIYLSRDIAAALDRFQRFSFDEMLYVVDNSQMNHLRAVYELAGRIKPECGSRCRHVNFGRILGMSTRKGTAVMLSDILDEARDRMAAQQELSPNTRSRDPDTVENLGLSCLVISDLSHRRARDYEFSWDQALASKGDCGVALQYCHARLCSLESNCGVDLPVHLENVTTLLDCPEAISLIAELTSFEDVLYKCSDSLEPYLMVRYLHRLRTHINKALKVLPVKGQVKETAEARLVLFHCSRLILNAGLTILGVRPLEAM